MRVKKIFVVASGTGGHILPALHYAHTWHTSSHGLVYVFTGSSNLEQKILKDKDDVSAIFTFSINKFSFQRWWVIPLIIMQCIFVFCKTLILALYHRPEKIITTGGLLSIPIAYAGWLARRPIEIYELNVRPGKAIMTLLGIAQKIYITFHQTASLCRWGPLLFADKCVYHSYPLRFTEHDKQISKIMSIDHINRSLTQKQTPYLFTHNRKTIFILGGSQGSRLLNTLIKDFLLQEKDSLSSLQIIHQIGSFEEKEWDRWYETNKIPVLTFSYNEKIQEFYRLADLIICRAGAGTLFEIAFFEKPCIVIPLIASTTHHQLENAIAMKNQFPQLFTVIEQKNALENSSLLFNSIRDNLFLH